MADIPVKVTIKGEVVEFQLDMEKAARSVDKLTQSASGMSKSLSLIKWDSIVNLASRAYGAASSFYNFGRSVSEASDQISRGAEMTGMSIDSFQRWKYAAMMADVDAQSLVQSLKFLSVNMAEASVHGSQQAEAFKKMGVSIEDASGKMLPLESVMGQVMDKFAGWADGSNKMAIATALFGRAGYELIPFLNKGREGFDALVKEAEKYGIIIGKDLIEAGAKANDKFKEFEAALQAHKLAWTGVILKASEFLAVILKISSELPKFFKALVSPPEDAFLFVGKDLSTKDFLSTHAQPTKPAAPSIKEDLEGRKRVLKEIDLIYADIARRDKERAEMAEYMGKEDQKLLDLYKEMDKSALDFLIKTADQYDIAVQHRKSDLEINELINKKVKERLDLEKQIQDNYINFLVQRSRGDYEEYLFPGTNFKGDYEINKKNMEDIIKQGKEMEQFWIDVATNMGKSLTSGFFNLFTDGIKNAGDAFKKFAENMLNTFTNVIQQLISNFLLFGNVMGMAGIGTGKGFGAFSLLGLLMPNWVKGGASGGAPPPSGEKGASGGANYITILAVDSKSFADMVERNPSSILKVVGSDARAAGGMRNTIRSYG